MSNEKITIDVVVTDEQIKKAEKLVSLLKEAKSLAGEVASIEIKAKN